MRPLLPSLAALALMIAACGAPDSAVPEAGEAPAASAAEAGASAHGFITQNAAPPDGAAITRDDGVYRDTAGRPF